MLKFSSKMNYYIADTHFGHKNIIRFCNRPFKDVQEMQRVLINNWNQVVNDNDDVYIVGDMFFKIVKDEVTTILKLLKGRKHLILGNHDNSWISDQILNEYFISCNNYLEIHDCKKFIVLSHYPMLSYNKQSGAYMIHGHIHNDSLFDYWPILLKRPRVLNAGVDINNFKPVTLNELIENNQNYKARLLDSYPWYLLSVRFNSGYVYSNGSNREELYQLINPLLNKNGVIEIYESLYKLESTETLEFLKILKTKIDNNRKLKKLFKNFDLIYIDQDGKFKILTEII